MTSSSIYIFVTIFVVAQILPKADSVNVITDIFDKEVDIEFTGLAYGSWTVRTPLECAAHCSRDTDCSACSMSVNANGLVQCAFYTCDEIVHRTARIGSTIYVKEVPPPTPCPPGYIPGPCGHCYRYVQTHMPYQAAYDYCYNSHPGAYLADITSQVENDFITDMIGDTIWLGFRKVAGTWTRVHSGAVLSDGYGNWRIGSSHPVPSATEPDGTGDCVFMGPISGTWYDELCLVGHRAVCEHDG